MHCSRFFFLGNALLEVVKEHLLLLQSYRPTQPHLYPIFCWFCCINLPVEYQYPCTFFLGVDGFRISSRLVAILMRPLMVMDAPHCVLFLGYLCIIAIIVNNDRITELVVGGGIEVEVMAMAISIDVHVVLINYINV